jgi:hypothetical protein
VADSDERNTAGANAVEHCLGIVCPLLETPGADDRHRIGQASAALVEPNHAAEGRHPP